MNHSVEAPAGRTVLVAGDVTMDWNIARRASAGQPGSAWTADDRVRICWQPGGAALLGRLISAVAADDDLAGVVQIVTPGVPQTSPAPGDPRIHHVTAICTPYEGGIWRVQQFLGLDRARERGAAQAPAESGEPRLIVLDDANLGFRDTSDGWPRSLTTGAPRWIVLKMSRPVAQGGLWELLLREHAERVVAIVTIDDLRKTEVQISRNLSWERTAQDIVWELTHNPRVNGLARCAHAVVSFGTAGAVLLSNTDEGVAAQLFTEPQLTERGWEPAASGRMIGNTITLTAAIVRQLMLNPEQPEIARGIQTGIAGMRTLYQIGFGTSDDGELAFPIEAVAREIQSAAPLLSATAIQNPVQFLVGGTTAPGKRPRRSGFWTILEDRYSERLDELAEQIVLEGLDAALKDVPRAQIGALVTVDRQEIEALRSIQNLLAEYCGHKQKRPLSIAVFGPPGSGKSFGVEQVANSVCPGDIRSLTFNLSQFARPEQLYDAFHQVRDIGLTGKIPLVFWDEFDTALDREPLGWLRYFLAPMQDGSFQQGEITHPLGQCLFVFAGGTSERFEAFGAQLTEPQRKAAKVPDFISRLKGYLNVLGPNRVETEDGADPYYVIRRAILLRSLLLRHAPRLFSRSDGVSRLRIDSGVLRGFLRTRTYRHGIRSMESLITMSTLAGATVFERSSLPAQSQLDIHVDSLDFLALVQQIVLDDALTERLAEAAHEVFCEGKRRDGWRWGPQKSEELLTHPLLIPYRELNEAYKESNRVTVRTIPQKLAVAGYVMIPARSNEAPVEFPGDDLEKLAHHEHEIWMQAKLAAGYRPGTPTPEDPKRNEYLIAWEEVPDAIREIDRDLVRGIPRILARAGYAVVKIQHE